MTGDHGPGPIEDYALLSDLRTAALVGKDGSIDWLCLPRFDAPSCFARLLGNDRDGHWQIAPTAPVRAVHRRYRDNSLVLETDFHTEDGVLRLIDSMPPHEKNQHDQPCLVRIVEGISGEVDIKLRWVVRFAYGDAVPWVRRVRETDPVLDEFILAIAGPHTAVLRGDILPRRAEHERAHELVLTVRAGERLSWVMRHDPRPQEPPQWHLSTFHCHGPNPLTAPDLQKPRPGEEVFERLPLSPTRNPHRVARRPTARAAASAEGA
ncbi:trehalase-like domain-containing protein [Saccharopolyspora pogona]|uniref:trehalase-like domain-containing protein n=1 Tax=Saccharopolyspora pogona TaxID=333966 RepID=UPI001CC2456F|nr:trehalase-like domain-containing protein [Saccharopolyspora pogona]